MTGLRHAFVKRIYGDHNAAPAVRRILHRLLAELPAGGVGLNVGAGAERLDPRVRTLEIEPGPGIDCVGSAEDLPLADASLDLVISQEVLEHVARPRRAVAEFFRVLRPGGTLYLQLPFVIGYHPCPHDYWRFTDEGLRRLVADEGFTVRELAESVGSATGHYRIAVEFGALLGSAWLPALYRPWKALFALLLYPVKWLDPLLRASPEGGRIAGGHYVVCTKPEGRR